MSITLLLAQTPSVSPSLTRTIITPDAPSGGDTFVAILAIVLAFAAAIVGYSIIRGGRGL